MGGNEKERTCEIEGEAGTNSVDFFALGEAGEEVGVGFVALGYWLQLQHC